MGTIDGVSINIYQQFDKVVIEIKAKSFDDAVKIFDDAATKLQNGVPLHITRPAMGGGGKS